MGKQKRSGVSGKIPCVVHLDYMVGDECGDFTAKMTVRNAIDDGEIPKRDIILTTPAHANKWTGKHVPTVTHAGPGQWLGARPVIHEHETVGVIFKEQGKSTRILITEAFSKSIKETVWYNSDAEKGRQALLASLNAFFLQIPGVIRQEDRQNLEMYSDQL